MIYQAEPVEDPNEFFGQRGIVRRIFSRIGAERPQSVAVIGGNKSGKTSLLNYLTHDSIRREYLEDTDRFTFFRVNVTPELARDPESFIKVMNRNFLQGEDREDSHYDGLKKLAEQFRSSGKSLILLFDDFHHITCNEKFPLEFFSFLRSLANNYNLAYVTSSFLELQKLCSAKVIEESPFFNIFTNVTLGLLSLEEGARLLCSITGTDEETSRSIVAWFGGSPYVLKLVGAKLLKDKKTGNFSEKYFEGVLLPEVLGYFETIVSILPPAAFRPLMSIARGKTPDEKNIHHVRSLMKQGFLKEKGDAISSFSQSFSCFLTNNLSERMLKGRG